MLKGSALIATFIGFLTIFVQFEGFSLQMDRKTRTYIVSQFTPDKFFAKYPRSLHDRHPTYDADNAPLNTYTRDFAEISAKVRCDAGWTCQECGQVLANEKYRGYLDVHHVNGNKQDNRLTNLKVLCVGCHATQPNHHHMKSDPRHRAYLIQSAQMR